MFSKKLFTRHVELNLDYFIFVFLIFIDPHKNLPIDDPIIEGIQFVRLSLNKVDQFAIRIKVDEQKIYLRFRMCLFEHSLEFFHGIVGIDLRRRQVGMS
jgi:hypothetical protein